MASYVLADSGVVSRLTAQSEDSAFYHSALADRWLAINFQVEAELMAFRLADRRMRRLTDLLAATLKLPHSRATSTWYARVAETRGQLRKLKNRGGDAGDADMWVIASALEYELALLSHDGSQVQLARALRVDVFTSLPALRGGNPAP